MLKKKLLTLTIFSTTSLTTWSYLNSQDRPTYSHKLFPKTNTILQKIQTQKPQKSPQFLKSYLSSLEKQKLHNYISSNIFPPKNSKKNTFSIKTLKFAKKAELKRKNAIFQNLLFAMVDSQMGYFSALLFGLKPCATAYLGYECFKEIEIGRDYIVFAFPVSVEGRNAFVDAVVVDEDFEIVMKLYSRFVKIDWKNSFRIKS